MCIYLGFGLCLCMCTTSYLQCSGNGLEELGVGKWPPLLTGYFLLTPQTLLVLHTGKTQVNGKVSRSSTNHIIP